MKTYYVDKEMLGDGATIEQAKQMVTLLNEHGIQAEYGSGLNTDLAFEFDDVWDECLDIISQESYA